MQGYIDTFIYTYIYIIIYIYVSSCDLKWLWGVYERSTSGVGGFWALRVPQAPQLRLGLLGGSG